jgi:hypothetical protein
MSSRRSIRTGRARRLAVLAAVPLLAALAVGCTKYGATLLRPEEPVVLDGSALPKLLGTAPQHVVGFAWDGKAWQQIPVQVDQRDWVNPGQILNRPTSAYSKLPDSSPYKVLVYTNPATASPGYTWWPTFTGTASHSGLGADDEVSFLGWYSGQLPPAGTPAPSGVDAASLEQVKVSDPLASGQLGYVYLFSSPTLTGGGAGSTGVTYTFSLDAGNYEATYRMGTAANSPNNLLGPNPEHSTVSTPTYTQALGDRWLNNGLTIGGGSNILERGRIQLVPSTCGRSEDTFDDVIPSSPYEAGFIVNISGPVRAIRSSMGANSGQYTVSTDIYYPQREDSTVDLRVHTIPGAMTFDDFLTGTTGLTYYDSNTTGGVAIDGKPDAVSSAATTWQMVKGSSGSMVTTHSMTTDIPGLQVSTYYQDRQPASPTPCTGDNTAWGQNGLAALGAGGGNLPCTDPTIYGTPASCPTVAGQSTANVLSVTRHRYFEPTNFSTSDAGGLAADTAQPDVTTVTGSIG